MIQLMITLLATAVVLGVLIFVHELGHFMVAKAVDIEVPRFSIGFGPKILGFKRGETEYVISLLPLGGYVKMAGTEDMEVIEGGDGAVTLNDTGVEEVPTPRATGPRDFDAKSLPARAAVISAGVIMNLLFAFVAFTVIGAVWGIPADPGTRIGGVIEEMLPPDATALSAIAAGTSVTAVNDKVVSTRREMDNALAMARAGDAQLHLDNGQTVTFKLPKSDSARASLIAAFDDYSDIAPVIQQVVKDDVADRAGLKPGDRVISAAGEPVTLWTQFTAAIERNPGKPLVLVVDRKGEQVTITVVPRDMQNNDLHFGRIGVGPDIQPPPTTKAGLGQSIQHGVRSTWQNVALTFDFLSGMLTGRMSPRNMGGPIMIGQLSGEFARRGPEAFLSFMALLSVNLAVLNMLPIPVLDGGHLVFLAIEGLRRGRPLSIEARMRATQVGFFMIVALMIWAVGNDVWRLIF